jgi:predicted metalloprotease
MRWTPGDRSNIEDRRGSSARMGAVPMGIGGLLVLLVLSWFTGVDFLSLVGGGGGVPQTQAEPGPSAPPADTTPEEERMVDLVDTVLADAQSTWSTLLRGQYQPTSAVIFRDATQSTCGFAQAAIGPFYCPADRRVYLDLSFFNDLRQRFGAPGEFAQAYVIAHEIGHHVQTITGVEARVRQLQQSNPAERNALSVLMELQADCYAGVWGHGAAQAGGRVDLDPGDLDDGLRAAAAIGDDTIQRRSGGRVMPDRFTHGTSEQRVAWFRRGFETGDPNVCNTFER